MSTYSVTRSQTITHTDAKHVNWKIRSDLRLLRVFFDMFNEQHEQQLTQDLYQWIYRGYASVIRFVFYEPGTEVVRLELAYKITRSGSVNRDDNAGDIPYMDLSDTTFTTLVSTTQAWRNLQPTQRRQFYQSLVFNWGSSNLNLVHASGSWQSDRAYSSNQLSASRSIYRG